MTKFCILCLSSLVYFNENHQVSVESGVFVAILESLSTLLSPTAQQSGRQIGAIGADGRVLYSTDPLLVDTQWEMKMPNLEPMQMASDQRYTYLFLHDAEQMYFYIQGRDKFATAFLTAMRAGLMAQANLTNSPATPSQDEEMLRIQTYKHAMRRTAPVEDIELDAQSVGLKITQNRVLLILRTKSAEQADIIAKLSPQLPDNATMFPLSRMDVALMLAVTEKETRQRIVEFTEHIQSYINRHNLSIHIGISGRAPSLHDLAGAYDQALHALSVGMLFMPETPIYHYEALGLGGIIYGLDEHLCMLFLEEVCHGVQLDTLDEDDFLVLDHYFRNNLNTSETARAMFLHRNTLVYRIERIKKQTGIDIHRFDGALSLKIALMVKKKLDELKR